ncbi:hypothetical protein RHO14_07925 [Orbus wheelerorum]|uniref:hypothetical protein n=1 Tax=Orbus wheelerorum TaxID=3074111 RepID=UPI00370D1A30
MASVIINGAITVATEGMDGVVASGDTAFDVLALLATCSTSSSYCEQAKTDYSKINGTIGATVDAITTGDAWNSTNQMLNDAWNGDQKAQENTAALIAAILSPSKSLGNLGKTGNTITKVENVAEKGVITEIKTGKAVGLDEFNKLNQIDIHAGKIKPAEASAAVEIQNSFSGNLKRIDDIESPADFVFTSGPNKGKTVDFMFTTANGTAKEIEGINKFFNNNWNNNINTLSEHLNKADIVPLDFRNLNQANQQRLLDHIKTLPASSQNKIVIMR